MKLLFIILSILFTAPICISQEFIQNYYSSSGDHTVNYLDRIIVITGTGASNKNHKSIAEKKLWAMTEARKNCITHAALAVSKVRISGKTVMKDGRLSGSRISLKIRAYVSGITDITEKYETLDDGSILASAKMIIHFDGDKGINNLIFKEYFENTAVATFPESSRNTGDLGKATGIVFDVREFPVEPSVYPHIYDENDVLIYGPDSVSREYAVKQGIVGYAADLNRVRDRIGDDPVILKVKSLKPGDRSSIVVGSREKTRLIELQKNFGLLNDCRVVFLIGNKR